jgi:predicted regulator of Ras-like GTPase activity (Roadblock/LC7/MglB family)
MFNIVMEMHDSIDEILKREPSVLAAIILDKDGIIVADRAKDNAGSAQELAIEYVAVMRQIIKVTDVLNVGSLEEVLISTEKSVIVIRLITRDYYLILVTNTEGNTGKAKYLAKLMGDRLEEEFL